MRARVDLDLFQQMREFLRVYPGVVDLLRGLQNVPPPNLCRRIPFCVSVCDRIAKDLTSRLQGPLCNVPCAPSFYRSNHGDNIRSFDVGGLESTQAWQDV